MAENDNIIPQSKTKDAEYLGKGVHLVRITSIEANLDRDKNVITDKNGNPSLKITSKDEKGKLFIDRIYYGSEKVQWVLDGMMKALGVDNTKGSVSKDEVIGKEVFVAIEEVKYVDAEGNQLYKDNGTPRIFTGRYRYFKVIDRDVLPVISEEKLVRTVVDKTSAKVAPPPVQTEDMNELDPNKTSPSSTVDTQTSQPDSPWPEGAADESGDKLDAPF